MSKENIFCYVVGTAGAGKSTLTAAYDRALKQRGLDVITLNLDPGAERLPYTPDVDIRDWIKISEVMEEHGLGPNGAQVAAADMVALNLTEVQEELGTFRSDYVLVDTPGQVELFVFRESGRFVVQNLNPERSMVAYLLDPFLARTASGFASQLMLGATTQFRLQVPLAPVLSKADVLSMEDLDLITSWSHDADALEDAVVAETPSMHQQLSVELVRALASLGGYPGLIHVSSQSGEGFDDLNAAVQSSFFASEDLLSD